MSIEPIADGALDGALDGGGLTLTQGVGGAIATEGMTYDWLAVSRGWWSSAVVDIVLFVFSLVKV